MNPSITCEALICNSISIRNKTGKEVARLAALDSMSMNSDRDGSVLAMTGGRAMLYVNVDSDGTTFRAITPNDQNACFSGVVAKGGVKLSISGGKNRLPIVQLEINMEDGGIRLTLLKDGDITHEFCTSDDVK